MRACTSVIASIWLVGLTASWALAQSAVPAPWSSADIGAPAAAGSATFDGTSFAVAGGGKDIWSNTDEFQFVFQQISGNAEIVARVDSLTGTSAWAKAGVMFRASLAPDSAHAFALVSRSNGVRFQRRRQTSGSSTDTSGPAVSAPRWLRLTRVGTRLTGYVSADGGQWTLIASDTIALGVTAYVGLAVTSHDPNSLAHASFSGVSATSVALPSPQQDADIGAPAIAGSAQYRQGSYTIKGAGADIWGTSDQFHYVYQQVSGDVDIVARVASIAQTSSWAKAGVMIRESLSADARHASAFATAGRGFAFQRRIDPGGISTSTGGGLQPPPGWVRLVRTGYQFQAFWSSDGASWTPMGTDTVPMTDPVYVGIAVTSHNTLQATTAVVDSLTIGVNGGTTNQPPTVSLTAPSNGATFTAPADVTITASASDPENHLARVDLYQGATLLTSISQAPYSFVWQSVPAGSYQLTAVAHDADGGSATSAAVAITVASPTNQPPSVSLTSPANGAAFTAPATITFAASASDPENRLARVDFYRGTTLLGSAATAPYTFTWSGVAAGSYALSAKAFDQDGGVGTSATVNVTVTAPANKPPTVSLTSPANGATFTAPATITLAASASDPENRMSRVDFYRGTTLLGSATTAPYTFTWSNVPAGSYALSAKAFDQDGGVGTSATISVTVAPAANQPPSVSLTSPSSGATFTAPATLNLAASASDPENRMARVEFYQGTTLLGSATAAPYTFTWSNVPAGLYALSAKAFDQDGGVGTSTTVNITVTSTYSGPKSITFTASTDQAIVSSYILDVFASGADPNTAVPIASSSLGKPTPNANNDISVDQTAFFMALAPGTYVATVSAIDSGGRGRGAPVTFVR